MGQEGKQSVQRGWKLEEQDGSYSKDRTLLGRGSEETEPSGGRNTEYSVFNKQKRNRRLIISVENCKVWQNLQINEGGNSKQPSKKSIIKNYGRNIKNIGQDIIFLLILS